MNSPRLFLLLCLMPLCLYPLPIRAQGTMPKLILQTQFRGAEALQGWQGVSQSQARLVPNNQGGQAVLIEQPAASGAGTRTIG